MKRRLKITLAILPLWLVGASALGAQTTALSERAEAAVHQIQSGDPGAQRVGFLQLEALRERAAVPLIEPYLEAKDDSVRAYAYRSLVSIQGKEAIPQLLAAFESDKSERVKRSILFGLEPYSGVDTRVPNLFVDALTARSTEVRMAAVDVVSRLKTPEAKAAIQYRAKKEWRRDVKRALKLALERMSLNE